MNKKKLFNIVATIIFGLFLIIFNILYCTLVFVPFGYSSLLVSTFVICDSILLVFFVLEGVILFRTIIEEKEYIKTNEFIFGDKIEFDNLEMFVKKVSKIINTKKEESTDNDVVARILLQFGSAKLDFSFSKKKKHKKRG